MNFADIFEVATLTTSAILLSFGVLFGALTVRRHRADPTVTDVDMYIIAPVRTTMRLMLAATALSIAGLSTYLSVPLHIVHMDAFTWALIINLVIICLLELWAIVHLMFGADDQLPESAKKDSGSDFSESTA